MISFFFPALAHRLTVVWARGILACVLLCGLAACEHRPQWMNTSNWFGQRTVEQNDADAHPGFGKGPLAPPEPAPVPAVQSISLPKQQPSDVPQTPLNAAAPTGKTKVAILLPLTGKNATLGQAMLNAAQLAVFDSADTRFELMPRDTGTNTTSAETAARDAVASGAQLLIGPLFAADVPAVHDIGKASTVATLTLSTDTTLAANGLYVMGFAPNAQVERVVAYATSRGLRHFAALIPATPYGALVSSSFSQSALRHGGIVITLETYDPAKRDAAQHIQKIALNRDQIDALFLPLGGTELSHIVSQLNLAGIDSRRMRLLGTGLWDEADLGRQSPYMVGGWYAASDPAGRRSFLSSYHTTYGSEPPRLATLAYDATALAAVLSKRGAAFDTGNLTNPNGFAGLDGIFRLNVSGTVERGLAVNEVTPLGAQVIDPAPKTFAGN